MTITRASKPDRGDLPNQIRDHFATFRPGPESGVIAKLAALLSDGRLTKSKRNRMIRGAGLLEDVSYRKAEIDLVLSYIQTCTASQRFDKEERQAFEVLKELFEIEEGEFAQYRAVELATMLTAQLERILEDDVIDPKEDEYQVALQDALDLGFDQYMAMCRRAFEHVSLRLQEELASAPEIHTRREIERKLTALAPLIRLAELQHRTLGALY